jgi:hypothetical protein
VIGGDHQCPYREHSVTLNRVAWAIHAAMGLIPDDVETYVGDIEHDLDEACRLIRAGREVERARYDAN